MMHFIGPDGKRHEIIERTEFSFVVDPKNAYADLEHRAIDRMVRAKLEDAQFRSIREMEELLMPSPGLLGFMYGMSDDSLWRELREQATWLDIRRWEDDGGA